MNKRSRPLLIGFIVISSLILFMGIDLLTIALNSYSQFLVTICSEIFTNMRNHIHFNPNATIPSFILLATVISISLAFLQTIKFTLSHQQFLHKHQNKTKLPQKLNQIIHKHHLQNITFIINKKNKLLAYTAGIIKPRIILSNLLIKKTNISQLEAIVLHELYHVKKRHVSWLLFIRITSSLFFFVPLLEYLAQQLKTEFELAADAFVVQKQKTRKHLCSSLAFNLKHANSTLPHFANLSIEKRVELLTTNKIQPDKIKIKTLSISFVSIIFMLGIIFTGPNKVTADFNNQINKFCNINTQCQTTDCIKHSNQNPQTHISHLS